ncbi:competence damage-inducible protein A [Candidatus Bathyarchaeota archaeon]|nr:competence damage-inducible protein A [Candidatus Bathyarchaeota archaeon]MBS7613264.1 competence damage-inducible protein A [Candidatus Bathyarchaeota archaeon]MBS7618488.1 competence damage-inducible protein A [Candidatus Bathyarchaeota archaeon]
MIEQLKFEILTIGNELLIGKILNTNAHWLSRRITNLGGRVTRIITIGDDVGEISSTVRDCLARKPDFIITVGGLGPTFDDKTLEGVARALNLSLKVNSEALNMVKMKYESLGRARGEKIELTPARIKMATLPEKAKPLTNPVGTAPGVLLETDGVTIICLPGVPEEMKAIFEDSISLIIRGKSKLIFCEKSLRLEGIYESDLAPIIDQVLKMNPRVYIKSHPRRGEGGAYIELHLSTSDESLEECFRVIDVTASEVKKHVVERGGRVTEIPIGE